MALANRAGRGAGPGRHADAVVDRRHGHVADAVLFHWILAIHHVRMDATNVIGWDIALFAVGLVFVLIGWKVGASVDGHGGASHTGPRVLPMLLTVLVSVAGS